MDRNIQNKLSLIISAYNEEKYIGDCLQYILEASGKSVHEIIVIDNASTDKTGEVAARYPGVRVIREDQKGLTKARQRGYLEATGNLQAYLDADGHMPREWVAKVLREFEKHPDLVLLSGPALYYDVSPVQSILVKLYWLVSYIIYLFVGYMAQGGNFILTKSALDTVGGFDTSIAFYGEDTNIARRAHEIGKVKFTLGLPMYTTGRRFSGQGFAKTAYLYVKNFFGEVFLKHPTTDAYIDVR
jgi:glycosyltransferase involved in cell wall biosynthesis